MSATLENVVEVLLLASGRALKVDEIVELLSESAIEADGKAVRAALLTLEEQWHQRGLELREVASGFRLQVRPEYAPWLSRLWAERPARYSRALLETLALIAYRQPITRGEIEDVRGVSVSANIVKTLLEREWVRVLGHREVPGRPAIYGTTRTFLDDFNLKGLEDLPPLAEVRDIDRFHGDLFNENNPASAGGDGPASDANGTESVSQDATDAPASEALAPGRKAALDVDALQPSDVVADAKIDESNDDQKTGEDTSPQVVLEPFDDLDMDEFRATDDESEVAEGLASGPATSEFSATESECAAGDAAKEGRDDDADKPH